MKFVMKQLVVEALRFKANHAAAQEIIEWVNRETGFDPSKEMDPPVMYYYGRLTIRTPHGDLNAKDGDWVVKGPQGFYLVESKVFAETFTEGGMGGWEYKVVQFHWNETVEGSMNNLGMQGWELVTCQIMEGFYKCVFKKQRGG